MRRIEEELEGILIEIEDRLTFYNLDSAKRSVKLAIFHFSTMSLICLLLITAMTSSLFLTAPPISTIYGQQSLTTEIIPNATTGEVPAMFEFEADITGSAGLYTISWDFGDGSEGSDEQTVIHTFEQAGTYNVSLNVTDTSNQTAFDSMEITVEEALPIASVEITSNGTEGIAPATFDFQATITGGTQPYTYLWDFGDGTEETDEQTVVHTFEQAGTYNVILAAIDTSNQNASDSVEINVGAPAPPDPLVEIMPSSIVGFAPATFDFEASVIGGTEPYTYSWNFDGDEIEESNEPSISHTVEGAGIYDVALTVTDSNGRTSSDEIAIIAVPSIGWVVVLVVLASIVIGGIALAKYKMNQRRRGRRMDIPTSAIVDITAKGGIDQ
jgi:PKD repeat protein